jgi:putative inorganic carbon (hco3(-)) transporter
MNPLAKVRSGQPAASWRWSLLVLAAAVGGVAGTAPVTAAVLASVVFAGAVMAARPDWAAVMAVAILYSNAAVVAYRVHGLPKAVELAAALLLAVALVHHLVLQRRPVLLPSALPWVAVYLIVQIVGALRATEPAIAMETVQDSITSGLLLYLAFANAIRTRQLLRRSLWTVLIVGALLGVLSIHQSATGSFRDDYLGFAQIKQEAVERHADGLEEERADPRLAGPIGEKNYYAQIMFVLVPMGVLLAAGQPNRRRRFGCLVLAGTVMAGGALTTSRGGAIGLVLAFVVLVAIRYLPLRQFVGAAVGVALLLSAVPGYVDRLVSIESVTGVFSDEGGGEVDVATSGRLGENFAALRVFVQHPVIGVGPGMFAIHYREQAIEGGFFVHEDTRAAHSLVLQLAAEYGVVGAIAVLGAVGVTLRELARARRRLGRDDRELRAMLAAIFAAIVTYLTTGLFLSLKYERYFWFFLALGAAGAAVAGGTRAGRQQAATATPDRVVGP